MVGDFDGDGEWRAVHEALVELACSRAGMDFDEGRWLLAARRGGVHQRLGAGSFTEYVERLFGYAPRLTHDKLRVATALESLPLLAQALREGSACWSSIRELTRVATPNTEAVWLEQARHRTVHEVEKLVSGHRPGSLPSEPKEAKHERFILRLEVSGETYATYREAETKLRREAGGHLDDDALLILMARYVLGGPTDEGRASYQLELNICEACGGASQSSNGELIPISSGAAEAAVCDSQVVPSAHAGASARRAKLLDAHGAAPMRGAQVPDAPAGASTRDAQSPDALAAARTRSAQVPDAPAGASTRSTTEVPDAHAHAGASARDANEMPDAHAGASARGASDRHRVHTHVAARAKQGVPPAVRREVLRRDHRRCRVPGCRHATWVDIHHVDLRSQGGDHRPANLITLCGAHHHAVHHGELFIEPGPEGEWRFHHADGTPYGGLVSAKAADIGARAFRALCGLDFGDRDARRAVAETIAQVGDNAELELVIRRALELLTKGAWSRAS